MQLYDYFRSSAAYRVRIALNLKGQTAERKFVHLIRNGGEHNAAAYRAENPQGLVPALKLADGSVLTQSLAIIEYLNEVFPEPDLLPGSPVQRAHIRAIALIIACDIHPLNNLRILNYLKGPLARSEDDVATWYRRWISDGFRAIEQLAGNDGFVFGSSPTLADVCLVPQVFNARRFDTDLSAFPKIVAIAENCSSRPEFADARPEVQPDAG